jgi:hypothetical protein
MSYIWRTMEDDRVRLEHAARNGLVFDDNYRPEPGEEFNCRCIRESTPEEDTDDDPTSLPAPNPFGTFTQSFASSFAINTAISLSTQVVLGKVSKSLPGPAKLIMPALTVIYGLITGESASNITAQVAGSFIGGAVGKSASNLLLKKIPVGAIFGTSPVVNQQLVQKVIKQNIKSKLPDTLIQNRRVATLADAVKGQQVNIQTVPTQFKNISKSYKENIKARIRNSDVGTNKAESLKLLAGKLRNGKVF